jgi:Rrf2 family transcriptional regulator, iron-sulfur cluster assembly transcription factor
MRLGLSERHLEPLLQALARHDILKSTRGPRGGYELAREERRITADDILRAVGTTAEMDCTLIADSALLKDAVLPVLGQAEEAFSAELVRINVEDLVQSAAELGSLAAGNEFAELPAC